VASGVANEGQIGLNLPPVRNRIVLLLKIERFDMSIKKEMEKLLQAERKKLEIEGKLD
jgi:hypothetical protein